MRFANKTRRLPLPILPALPLLLLSRLLLPILLPAPATAQDAARIAADLQDADSPRAEQLYRAHCGRCHGVLGLGGEGPELARAVLARAPSQEDLERVIRQGIAGTGMPGARSTVLADPEVSLVARHVRWLGTPDCGRGDAGHRRRKPVGATSSGQPGTAPRATS